jgi:predicted sugar kinase
MQALPALAEQDLTGFGEVISALQNAVGEHFAPIQGGVFTSLAVAEAMQYLKSQGAVGIGQTSWGPTGFCLVADQEKAEALLMGLTQKRLPHLSYQIASARNIGAELVKK